MGSDSTSTPTSDASAELAPGELLVERYRITERLGSGGYGQVLAAHDQEADRPVAVKILHPDAASRDPAALARMRQEAEILGAIDHPNVVEVLDVGQSDHGEFIVMELLQGPSIAELLEDEGPADADRAAPIARQLLSALASAHQKQVLHRDLKPDNILLIDAGEPSEDEQAKLLDFGIAKAQELLDDDPDEGITLVKTRAGGFVGTPRYCSPEVAVGDPAGPSSDLFSLGLVLSEWLTGSPLIEAETQTAVLAVLIRPEPLDVSGCPTAWQPWLSRMLAKSPEQRYQSADEALDSFEVLVEGSGDGSEMAATVEQPSPIAAGDLPTPAESSPPASPSGMPTAGEPSSFSMTRFLVVAAITCALVLLVLFVARALLL
jgi:eukaryotic-like serine/threonine-protein kinase